MSPIHFVTSGLRLMPPRERAALQQNPGHHCDRTVSVDEQTYEPAKYGKPFVEKGESKVLIIFTRFWSTPRWKFVVEARNRFGDVLASCTRETYTRESIPLLEEELRAKQIIR
jgi:hypothetical protein